MFTERDLNELVEFQSEQSPVLSLYLNVDLTQQTTDQYKLTLRSLLKQVADGLAKAQQADMATLCTRIQTAAELFDPHVVKVIMDKDGYAIYFSRAVIPWDRDAFAVTTETLPDGAEHYRHLGIYAYRAGFLKHYNQLDSCHLEQMESLEQLRVLWHGGRIHVAEAVELPGHGIDTEGDLEKVRAILADK